MRKYRSKTWLTEKYLKEGLSLGKIGRLENVSDDCVLYWMKKHGISRRSLVEIRALKKKEAEKLKKFKAFPVHFEGENDLVEFVEDLKRVEEEEELVRNDPEGLRVLKERALKEYQVSLDTEHRRKDRLERERQREKEGVPEIAWTVKDEIEAWQRIHDEPTKRRK